MQSYVYVWHDSWFWKLFLLSYTIMRHSYEKKNTRCFFNSIIRAAMLFYCFDRCSWVHHRSFTSVIRLDQSQSEWTPALRANKSCLSHVNAAYTDRPIAGNAANVQQPAALSLALTLGAYFCRTYFRCTTVDIRWNLLHHVSKSLYIMSISRCINDKYS